MLQLQTNTINVCRIGKLLAKYNIKASITDSLITLDGDIPDDLLTQLCNEININFITNFVSNEPLPENTSCVNSDEIENESKVEAAQICSDSSKFDLIYPEVRRGEVYECDFGTPHGSEQGFLRYAIVIQNNLGNEFSPTTIVIACSTEPKKDLPVHLSCKFSSKNMPDYSFNRLETFENVIMAEQIRTVDKTRLRRYIGFLTPEFMEQIEEKIYISLDLKPKETIVEKEVFVDKIVEKIPTGLPRFFVHLFPAKNKRHLGQKTYHRRGRGIRLGKEHYRPHLGSQVRPDVHRHRRHVPRPDVLRHAKALPSGGRIFQKPAHRRPEQDQDRFRRPGTYPAQRPGRGERNPLDGSLAKRQPGIFRTGSAAGHGTAPA